MQERDSTQQILEETEKVVVNAGELIRHNWQEPREIEHKGRIDLVTKTDVQVEQALKDSLSKILPEADFWAEESASAAKDSNLIWIIDPLDGTTNFVHYLMHIAISVALWQDEEVKLGIIYLPLTGEIFRARARNGAYLNQNPISVSPTSELEEALIATGFPYNIREEANQVVPNLQRVLLNSRGIRRLGAAAVDLAYTACGRFDGFFEQGLKPWDTAAGWLLVKEAGGKITQYAPSQKYSLQAPTILATNAKVHDSLGNLLKTAQ